jgi:glycosyltransferase involved in cell wall biosynthesis
MNLNKVSILIPLYNSEQYISETINSALSQTWTDLEIIIVDDGSTDNSYLIAKSFESQFVKVFHQDNMGASAARNFAFTKSTGNYIQYLDADDLLSPDKIENQINIFKQYGDDICTSCKSVRFTNDKSNLTDTGKNVSKDYQNPLDYIVDTWESEDYLGIHAWMIPRKVIYKIGDWDINLKRFQDGEFMIRVLNEIKEVKFVSNCKVYYRDTPNSITKINYDEIEKSRCYALIKVVNEIVIPSKYNRIFQAALVYLSDSVYKWHPYYPLLVNRGLETIKKMNASIILKNKSIWFNILLYVFDWKTVRNIELFKLKFIKKFSNLNKKL